MVFHFVNPGKSRVGNSRADPPADVTLNGLSIQPDHALLEAHDDGDKAQSTEISHSWDRIWKVFSGPHTLHPTGGHPWPGLLGGVATLRAYLHTLKRLRNVYH
jgi:hypothetical protein